MPQRRDRIHVFISSRMHELRDLRAILHHQLEDRSIDAFVYEAAVGANPEDPEQISLEEVARTDLFVLVIGDSHGEITEREYDRARELNKPCLVYERQYKTGADPELERFLKKLSGARGVPSRTTFDTAVDLAAKVANDVHAWLVREYRRLSAAQSTADQSSRRRSELGASLARLAASSSRLLPTGTSADLLAWQLEQWFEALEYPLDDVPEPGPHWVDMVVRVPARRRQFTHVLVRAKDGAIQSPDVAAALDERSRRKLDEVWIVSFLRVSPGARDAAKQTDGVHLYTLDELLEEDIDFEQYFEWLDREVRAGQIDRLYVPLAVTVNEVDASGVLHAQSTYDDLGAFVDQWLADTDGEHLSLLGEFGTGKSWFALKYAHDMVVRYRAAQQSGLPRPRVPLVVRLREYARGFKDVESLLIEFVLREHKIKTTFSVLQALNRLGRLLFIFDGFDEMAARVDQQKMVDNFWSLAAVLGPGSKAILTCRTEYFQFASQAREVFGGKLRGSAMREVLEGIRFQVATLEMFDEPRLRQVLMRRSDDVRLIDAVLANQTLVDLGRRPVMVDLLIEAMPTLNAEHADLSHVYYKAVREKMARDISMGRTFSSMADKMFFMCEMSWEMLATQRLKVHYKEIPDRIRTYFAGSTGSAEEDYWRHDLLSQTMLVRDDDGYYRPAHKSLVEFFAAYKLSAQLGALKTEYLDAVKVGNEQGRRARPQRWSDYFQRAGKSGTTPIERFIIDDDNHLGTTWGQVALDNATSELIYWLCGRDALIAGVVGAGGMGEVGGRAAARALEVAAFRRDLRHARLAGASVEGCRLLDTDMSGADLRGASFSGGRLERVSFTDASLSDASFKDIDLVDVAFRGAVLTNCRFEPDTRISLNIVGAVWGLRDDEDVLIVVVADGRVAAITPRARTINPVDVAALPVPASSPDAVASALLALQGAVRIGRNEVAFARCGWLKGKDWRHVTLDDSLTASGEVSMTGPRDAQDIEVLKVRVTSTSTNQVVVEYRMDDRTDFEWGANPSYEGRRLLCLGRRGTWAAVVDGVRDEVDTARLVRQPEAVVLQGFIGSIFPRGPETTDTRGAAASLSDAIVAIREKPDIVGFWKTRDGTLLGRARFSVSAAGATLDTAGTSVPSVLGSSALAGWSFEGPESLVT